VVLFAGTMGTAQALDCVIDAARRLAEINPRVQFVLVGGGVDVDRLKAQAAGVGNVRFIAHCTRREAAAMSMEADALLVHLRSDPLFEITIPSKTQAYLRAGRPILIGVKGDAADLVRAAGAGLAFEPENGAALTEAVNRLVGIGPRCRDAMGADGRAYYEAWLSFAGGVTALEQALAEACHRRRGATIV
jgi:colanic acid biosynthesis glycosyl transferase WcaI